MKSILVIDDNEEFRETAKMVLLDAGYDVFDAPAPKEALPILEAEGKSLDLIICDLHMPYCTGPESDEYVYSCETGLKTIQRIFLRFLNTWTQYQHFQNPETTRI